MIQIIPAILATTEQEFKVGIEKLRSLDVLKGSWIHIDLMDGKFVPNQSIKPQLASEYASDFKLEAHLMVEQPNAWFPLDSSFKRGIAHVEVGENALDAFISGCKAHNIEVGLAIKAKTPLEKLEPYFAVVDLVLVMSIEPGFQGQPFIPESLERIKELVSIREEGGFSFLIGIDGHVNEQDAKVIIEAGVDNLVVGSFLLKGDIDENLEKFWEKLKT